MVVGLMVFVLMVVPAFAHPGRTDSSGGHYNRSTGEYHYHHGYSAHDHVDGVCPYDNDDKTGESSGEPTYKRLYTSVAVAENWYDEYREEQAARKAIEKELQEFKSIQMRNLAFSAIVGLCGGLSMLIVQTIRSNKRMEDTKRRLLEKAADDVRHAKETAEVQWRFQVSKAASERDAAEFSKQQALMALTQERNQMENEKRCYKAQLEQEKQEEERIRKQNSIMFAKMARNADTSAQSIAYAKQVVYWTKVEEAADGYVYVPADLNTHVYHRDYEPCGVRNMVLASKSNVIAHGLKQCPVCDHAAQPNGDLFVEASPSGTKVYHRVDAYCAGYTAKKIRLSEAKRRGLKPCSKCFPPAENPKVWF